MANSNPVFTLICQNYELALCLTYLVKSTEFAELLLDYGSLVLGVRKILLFSLKPCSVLGVQ